MRTSIVRGTVLAAIIGLTLGADADKTTSSTPCTATSTRTGSYYDLRPDTAVKLPADGSKPAGNAPTTDYFANGYDYGRNFTLNVCAPVVEDIDLVKGVPEGKWANISAYYTWKGDTYSLGFASHDIKSRGRKLVLQYTGGSPCGSSSQRRDGDAVSLERRGSVHKDARYKYEEYEDEAETSSTATATGPSGTLSATRETETAQRRKSATISFSCDRDPTASKAAASFVGVDPDECAYFFDVRSIHACAGAEPQAPGSVGPGTVFGIILLVAILVYLGGGIFYQRTVSNQRGWRQLPNYSLWAGIWSFISDLFVAATSSCARFLPNRRGYHYLSGSPSRTTRQSRDREAENRLIDQYDEEWDD